jgi:plasmid stability protein
MNMATVIVDIVPADVYERLIKRAAAGQRSLPEEMLHLLNQALRSDSCPAPRLPDFIASEEISAPCDLPRSSQPVQVAAQSGPPRLPDPFAEDKPE